ncbi:hypothetical protein PFISCL1PPCAC_3769, partial [Pristionchus fissidentatus]
AARGCTLPSPRTHFWSRSERRAVGREEERDGCLDRPATNYRLTSWTWENCSVLTGSCRKQQWVR